MAELLIHILPATMGRKQSKRQTVREKVMVRKKIRDHERKLRKEARRNPTQRNKLKKSLDVPNTWPFKEQLINQARDVKRRQEEHKLRTRELRRQQVHQRRMAGKSNSAELAAMVSAAQREAKQYESARDAAGLGEEDVRDGGRELNAGRQSRRAFFRHLRRVVAASDVILQVLDARDPAGCRARAVEAAILGKDATKKIVLVLNKIDLVPKEAALQWLAALRREFPTVAFKASTQEQRGNLARASGRATDASETMLSGSKCVGADVLLQLLKNYARKHKMKTALTVGIIGYPNVGKSSLINSLKRSKAAGVSSTPGFTKAMQEIVLDAHIKLLDCPGIIFDQSAAKDTSASMFLRNCVSVEAMDDPETAVAGLVEFVMQHYSLPRFRTVDELLVLLAHKFQRVKKGGVPDKDKAARAVLQDWNAGKIPFYTLPPKQARGNTDASVVSQWAAEFDMDAVLAGEKKAVLDELPETDGGTFAVVEEEDEEEGEAGAARSAAAAPDRGVADALMRDDDDEESEEEGAGNNLEEEEDSDEEDDDEEEDDEEEQDSRPHTRPVMSAKDRALNPQVNQERAKALKKDRKAARKAARERLAGAEDAAEGEAAQLLLQGGAKDAAVESEEDEGDGAYDFDADFYQ